MNIGGSTHRNINSVDTLEECIRCGMIKPKNPVIGRYGLECQSCTRFSFCHFCGDITNLQNLCYNCAPPVLLLQQWFRYRLYNPDNGIIFKHTKAEYDKKWNIYDKKYCS